MKVKEIMARKVEAIDPETSIADAAEIMKAHNVSALPVCDGEELVGMLTERDIVVRATADGFHPEVLQSGEIMTSGLTYGYEDQDVSEVIKIMEEKWIRHLPILNRNKRLVGVLSLADIALVK